MKRLLFAAAAVAMLGLCFGVSQADAQIVYRSWYGPTYYGPTYGPAYYGGYYAAPSWGYAPYYGYSYYGRPFAYGYGTYYRPYGGAVVIGPRRAGFVGRGFWYW